MRAINHALTGAIIGLAIPHPVIAAGAAVLSHFVCDAIPHYGDSKQGDEGLRTASFAWLLLIDTALCALLVALLAIQAPANWLLAALCAFAAAAPDFASMPGFLRVRQGGAFLAKKTNYYTLFAKKIQWFERPIGAVVEVCWFVAGVAILLTYL